VTINDIPALSDLDRLASEARDAIDRWENANRAIDRDREAVAHAEHDLCGILVRARDKFTDNIGFGKWCETSGIKLSHQDRAAAIAMGREPELALSVLLATKRSSLRLIHAKEFKRLTTDGKTQKPKPTKPTPELEKALHAYDRRKLAGQELTYEAIMQEAGVSSTPVRRAIAMREAEEKVSKEAVAGLSMSAQQKLDAAIRSAVRRLELEAETRAINESKKRLDEWHLPNYMALLRKVEEMLKFKRGLMSRADYRKILRCVHPDTGAHVSDANRNEAFRLFTQLEARLVDDAEQADLKRVSTLPKTVEEMLARRKTKAGR
jgi:hypothetical protein